MMIFIFSNIIKKVNDDNKERMKEVFVSNIVICSGSQQQGGAGLTTKPD
jgi:hypothetical protein